MTVPLRPNYIKIAENVYVHKDYGVKNEEILSMISAARQRVDDFFGETKSNPTIIFCDNEKELTFANSGLTHTFYKLSYISIGLKEYCGVDVIAHELTHAESHYRAARLLRWNFLKLELPRWFDEGVATQNDYREQYSEEAWKRETNNGENVVALCDMATHKDFDSQSGVGRRFRYLCAKHEVTQWIEKHGKNSLLELLDGVKKGENFEKLYFVGD